MREIRGSTVNGQASTNGRVSVIRGRLRPVTAHASPSKLPVSEKLPYRNASEGPSDGLGTSPGSDHRETHSVARRDTSCTELHNNFLLSSEFCCYSGVFVTGSSKTSGLNVVAKTNPIGSLKGLGLVARPILLE